MVVLPTDEPVERLEPAASRRPGIKGAHRRRLPHRHLMALAELRRRVPVQLQRHRQRRLRVRPQRAIPRSRRRGLGDAAHPDRMVITARKQRRTSRSTQRRRVEAVVRQATRREPVRRRRTTWTTERARCTETNIIQQHDQHVRRALRWEQGLDRGVRGIGILGVVSGQTERGPVRDGQHRACMAVGTHGFLRRVVSKAQRFQVAGLFALTGFSRLPVSAERVPDRCDLRWHKRATRRLGTASPEPGEIGVALLDADCGQMGLESGSRNFAAA